MHKLLYQLADSLILEYIPTPGIKGTFSTSFSDTSTFAVRISTRELSGPCGGALEGFYLPQSLD